MYTHNQTIDAWIHGPWIWLYDTPKHAEGPLMFVVLWRGSFTKFRGPGHPPNKMCNATAKQRFISVAAKNGGIQKSRSPNKHNVPSNALSASPRKTVASKSLVHPTNKMCNAAAKQRFISVATKSGGIQKSMTVAALVRFSLYICIYTYIEQIFLISYSHTYM